MAFDDAFTRLVDTFFNGRPAPKPTGPSSMVTVPELIARGTSVIRYDGKLYEIKVAEFTHKK